MSMNPPMKPKMKIKVQFYHLLALTIVVLLCFYLMYRDIKRIEGNCFKLFKRVDEIQKTFEELQVNLENNLNMLENIDNDNNDNIEEIKELNIEEVHQGDKLKSGLEELGNVMKDIDAHNKKIENVVNNLENKKLEDVDNIVENYNNDDNDDNNDNNDNNDVDELLKNISVIIEDNSEDKETDDLSKLSEEELKKLSNDRLKEFLKSQNKPITGNKTKLINSILNKE
jgi:hypothetical protein